MQHVCWKAIDREIDRERTARCRRQAQGAFRFPEASGDRPATIEDLINYLVSYRNILDTITNVDKYSLSIDEIDGWLADIKKKIVIEIADDWEAGSYHERFLQRLRGPRDRGPVIYSA